MRDREPTDAELQARADAITAKVLMQRLKREREGAPKPPAQAQPPAPAIPIEPEHITPEWETWWLPEPVGIWVESCHAAFGVPRVMAIAAALCSACAVLQGKVEVEVKPGWREPLSLYWLVFSPTGSRKSALLKAATAPVRALQEALRRDTERERQDNLDEHARLKAQIERMRRATKAHKYTDGAQEHLQQLRELQHEFHQLTKELRPPARWLYDDINPTIVPRMMAYSDEAEGIPRVAVLDAEGTFLANLLGRHSGHINVDPLLKGYMGEPIDMVRAVHGSRETQNIHLDAAHLTLLLLIQPHYLNKIRAQPELGENGLLGRCLMTQCDHPTEDLSWDAPAIPESVQAGYATWIADLAAIAPETVWQVPAFAHPTLKRLHEQLERDRRTGKGAVGFTVRTLGRICRILAISELSQLSQPSHSLRESARTRVISKLTYLIKSCYSEAVEAQRLVEPPTDSLPRLVGRTLRWLGQCGSETVDLRQLCKFLHVKKDEGLSVGDSLVESGHLEQLAPVVRANRTLSVRYKVLSTTPDPREPPPPAVLAPLPTGPELDEPPESAPEPEEYLGDEDYEP